MKKIPILICIDVEPEARQIDSAAAVDWNGFEETASLFSEIRPRLEEATGAPARYSWFFRMDPQVKHTYGAAGWVATRYREAIGKLESAGDELGLHTHAWRWDEGSRRWT